MRNPLARPAVQRRIALALLVFGLALRGLVPVGYMPAWAEDSETLRFAVCNGISGTDAFPPGTRYVDVVVHTQDEGSTADERCSFGLMGCGVVAQAATPVLPAIGRAGVPRLHPLSDVLDQRRLVRAHRPRGPPPVPA